MNTCPVCGYDQMTHPPNDYYICPCCGTEFENDDFETSHTELRKQWLNSGARWFSRATLSPPNWNPYTQLIHAGLGYNVGAQNAGISRSEIELGTDIYHTEKIVIKIPFVASATRGNLVVH